MIFNLSRILESVCKIILSNQSILKLIQHVFFISIHRCIQLSPIIGFDFGFDLAFVHLFTDFVNEINSSVPGVLFVFRKGSVSDLGKFVLDRFELLLVVNLSSKSVLIKFLRYFFSRIFKFVVFVNFWCGWCFRYDLRQRSFSLL